MLKKNGSRTDNNIDLDITNLFLLVCFIMMPGIITENIQQELQTPYTF